IINYDLLDENLQHKYTLSLYSSQDNFVQPLKMVEGDVGIDQKIGGNKRVVWHAKDELGEQFKGDVSLEVKGRIYIPFVTLNNFADISSIKRGKDYNVTWTAGRGSNVLTFDVFDKKGEIVHTYTNIANVGEYQMQMPKDVKPGKDYKIRITDQKNKEDVVFTPNFSIKRRIPLFVKVGLAGLIASAIYLTTSNIQGESAPGEVPLLPDPITPF
ncbi:MAG: Ser-Thr-rich GPI-anchored membrane family protein, partial [Reichenbachiella sp.]